MAASTTTPDHIADALLKERLWLLWERTGDDALRRVAAGQLPAEASAAGGEAAASDVDEWRDWVSTALMGCYKSTSDPQVFALLFELNQDPFLQAIQSQVRRCGAPVDPSDVLQEVFLNIYRYPHRFLPGRADAFRSWGHRIVRNTLLKFLKGHNRVARVASLDDETGDREDPRATSPLQSVEHAESATLVDRAYLIYLSLYLMHFNKLSARERTALNLVEVEGAPYKRAAAELGIRLENLKMVIFRGRRKIFRGLTRTLADLGGAAIHASVPPDSAPRTRPSDS